MLQEDGKKERVVREKERKIEREIEQKKSKQK